jgi:hypothetical protein
VIRAQRGGRIRAFVALRRRRAEEADKDRSGPDGSAELLAILDGNPETHADWASWYYEQEGPLEAIQCIYADAPIDRPLVASLSESADFESIAASARAMGFSVKT